MERSGNTDIVILQETWCRGDGPTGCALNYREPVVPATKLPGVTQGRESGGIFIWYKSKLTNSVKLIETGKFYIWLEIDKELTTSEENILLCTTYIPPLESPLVQRGKLLHTRGGDQPLPGHILICGDLNARTGQGPDTISTQGDKHRPGDGNHRLPKVYGQL